MNIISQSQSGTIIDAEDSDRIFIIGKSVDVTIQNLTLTGGNTDRGGAIYKVKLYLQFFCVHNTYIV